jgi:hypothetical protein
LSAAAGRAQALEVICDPQFETNCRTRILNLIGNEQVRIDVAFWYMTDVRYSNALVAKFQAGVPVRVLVDPQANNGHPYNNTILQQLKNAGIPMRYRKSGGILHWKMMLFDGQNVVHFSKANFEPTAYMPESPNVNYFDEAVYFSSADDLTNTFRTKFDNLWTNTAQFGNYANVTTPTRAYGSGWPLASWMNLPPGDDFATRSVKRYNAEQQQIDVLVYRATDDRHADAMIAAVQRGVRVRIITEPEEYRDVGKLRHAYNMDRMSVQGVEIKQRNHAGFLHEALVVMRGLHEVIFGSSNWSPDSSNSQWEHNMFYTPAVNRTLDSGETVYQWFADQFDRKWNNTNGANAYVPFQPLPPTNPTYATPANGAAGVPLTATLKWDGGPWAWKFDLYFGTTPTPPLYAENLVLNPPTKTGSPQTYTISNLLPGTTYYWRVVGKTMADRTNSGSTWNFTTSGGSGGTGASDIVLYAGKAPVKTGSWETLNDATAAGGVRIHQPDRGAAKVGTAAASPANYFEMSFNAQAGIPYHLWFRGKADNNSYNNDSVWVQFSSSVDGAGTPVWRIGTASGTWMGIEDCSGCGISGWGWNDNGYGANVSGAPVYFSASGVQTIRIQQREDGISIDQIVLSPSTYLSASPGMSTNDSTILPEAGGTGGGTPPPSGTGATVVIHASSVTTVAGAWAKESDSTAADGIRLRIPNAGAPKLGTASASPSSYFEQSFTAEAGKPYHLWLRMKADSNYWGNDSVFVQFSGSQTASGAAAWRIGTTDALAVSLEEGNGAGMSGWGWNDNSYGSVGAPIYFATTGTQTIRVQLREDGVSVDQIVISAGTYLTLSPGGLKNDNTIVPQSGVVDGAGTSAGINEIVLHAASVSTLTGTWAKENDSTAAGGVKLRNPDAGAAKIATASASPASYFEGEFDADPDKPYHLWLRMQADEDRYTNDSVFVQFSGSRSSGGQPAWRIGTTEALAVSLEDDNGAGVRGWGWNDNAWAALGAPIYFDDSGTQTIRVQVREDGASVDQIVLSASKYLSASPGELKDDSTILPETGNP